MALDPEVILGVNTNPGIQPQNLMSMFQFAQEMQQYRQQQAGQNALRQVFSDPDSIDPKTGMPTQNALRTIYSVDPSLGVKLQDQSLEMQVKNAQLRHEQTETGKLQWQFMSQAAGAGVTAYDEAIKAGKSPADAAAAGQAARNAAAKNGGGIVGDDLVDKIVGSPFDPTSAKAMALSDPDWAREYNASQTEKEREKHDTKMEDIGDKRANEQAKRDDAIIGGKSDSKWQVYTGNDGKNFRYNPETAQATDMAGKPIAVPDSMSKLGSGNAFTSKESDLMGALAERGVSLPSGMRSKEQQKALYAGILERNPDKSPDEIADLIKKGQIEFGAQKKETGVAATQAGKVELAQNEIKRFSPLALEASKAVPRGSFMPINRLLQTADSELSDPDLKTLKIYVNSIMNAYDQLAARGGTDKEKREEARSLLTSADSPEAFQKAIDAFGKEAEAAHGAAVDAMKVPELPGDQKKPPKVGTSVPDGLPIEKLKKGVITTFGNGQAWTLDSNGNPKQVK